MGSPPTHPPPSSGTFVLDSDVGIASPGTPPAPAELAFPASQPGIAVDAQVPPSMVPSLSPSWMPSRLPSLPPSMEPSLVPSNLPSLLPSTDPSTLPSQSPTAAPTRSPTKLPTRLPTEPPILITYRPGFLTANENGLLLSTGLTARIIARTGQFVPYANGESSTIRFHTRPDFGATFPDPNPANAGGWIYVSNSEAKNSGTGGVGAITFDRNGNVLNYEMVLRGTTMNCGGGRT